MAVVTRDGGLDYGSLTLQAGLVLLVAVSAVLVSVQMEASLQFVLIAGVAGLVVGAVLTYLVVRNLREIMPDTPDMSDREW